MYAFNYSISLPYRNFLTHKTVYFLCKIKVTSCSDKLRFLTTKMLICFKNTFQYIRLYRLRRIMPATF